jgi:hypothetical protein
LKNAAASYRKSPWTDIDAPVEIWLEKDALTGVIDPITSKYDVALNPARGYASITFLYENATALRSTGKPCFIYHLGDSDPSGENAAEVIERELRAYAPDTEIHFERLAVTEQQISDWDLPTRPTKKSDSRAAAYGDRDSVELDSIDPRRLRKLVEDAINRHMSKKLYAKPDEGGEGRARRDPRTRGSDFLKTASGLNSIGEFRLPRRLRDRTRQINENGRGNAIRRSRTNLPERTNNSHGRYQDGLREGSLCSCRSLIHRCNRSSPAPRLRSHTRIVPDICA